MTLLIFYIILILSVSFLCSLLESVILSVSPAFIAVLLEKGRRSGRLLTELKINIDRPLAAILTLNTIANTFGAAGVGAQIHAIYGDGFLAAASATLAFVILIFSEIIPKTIGATYWKKLAPFCSYIIRGMVYMTFPVVYLSKLIRQLFGSNGQAQTTREEMIVTAQISANEGVIREKESRVIKNLLMLDTFKVSEVMTPRSVMMSFNETDTVGHIMEKHKEIRFSRIPLYSGNLDHISGILHRYKLMDAVSHDLDDLPLKKLSGPIHTVPAHISVSAALDQFIKRKEHLFLVLDDYGIPVGIVTLEDAIETLLGVEIVDEFDSVEDMRKYALEKWREQKKVRKH